MVHVFASALLAKRRAAPANFFMAPVYTSGSKDDVNKYCKAEGHLRSIVMQGFTEH
jgi:hypothetical protein